MWNIIKEYRHYLASIFLAIIPLIALNAGGKAPTDFYWFDRVAIAMSAPVQGAIAWTVDATWSVFENYTLLLRVRQNNFDLSQENRKLQNEIANFQEMVRENERLRHIVDFGLAIPGRKVVAQVIAQDVSAEFRVIRLAKGQRHGIERGMAVVTPEGIVGRVLRVTAEYADVLTLLDSSSAVDALVQRSRARGVIEGMTESTLLFKYLRRTDDIEIGDMVVSSGVGGLFPKGLVIGRVSRVERKNYGITQTVEVSPAVDFSKLEEVTVVEAVQVPLSETLPGLEVVTPEKSKAEKKPTEKAKEKTKEIKEPKEAIKPPATVPTPTGTGTPPNIPPSPTPNPAAKPEINNG
jgi:rod shape-determining protein MreC